MPVFFPFPVSQTTAPRGHSSHSAARRNRVAGCGGFGIRIMSTQTATELAPLNTSSLMWNGDPLNLEQYCGLWAIEEMFFNQQWRMLQQMDLAAHVRKSSPRTAATASSPDQSGIEVIEIRGTMTKQGSSLSSAGSTVRLREEIRRAKSDPTVKGVLFVIDSPGGTVAGTAELADEMRALSDVKPTVTLAEDLMASAGMYVGVQSRKVFANTPNAVIGSMGVFIGLYDMSGMAAKEGIKPVVIKTGELKGAGFPGSEITDAQKQMWQGLADESFNQFSGAVQRARKLTAAQLKELSRAGVFPAKQAITLGLIDGIRSFDQAVAELRSMIPSSGTTASSSRMEPVIMTTTTTHTPAAKTATETWNASVAELMGRGMEKAAAIQQLVKTRGDLHQAYVAEVNGRPASAFSMTANSESRSSAASTQFDGSSSSMTATQQWRAAVNERTAKGQSAAAAINQLIAERPDLHKAYLDEANGRA